MLPEINHNGKGAGEKWLGITRTWQEPVGTAYKAAIGAIKVKFGIASDAEFVDRVIQALDGDTDTQTAFAAFLSQKRNGHVAAAVPEAKAVAEAEATVSRRIRATRSKGLSRNGGLVPRFGWLNQR